MNDATGVTETAAQKEAIVEQKAVTNQEQTVKRGRGRPKGSKNKPKVVSA
jgi:hypothetical protein